MAIFNVRKTYSEFSRMWAVLKVFIELILDEFVSSLYKARGLSKRSLGKRIIASIVRRILRRSRGVHQFPRAFRKALERLGPTYVKFGQILSLRDDFLPERFTNELRKLQNQVPPIGFHQVKKVVEGEFRLPLNLVFKEFNDEPLAAASLAQTHLAKLKNGARVVVKVQRPGISNLIDKDISIMRRLARWAEKIPKVKNYSVSKIVDEFATYTYRELDFNIEGKNADKFKRNFSGNPDVIFPKIFWDYTTPRVLTMEYIRGFTPQSREQLRRKKINTKHLARVGVNAILKMLYQDGFFHGDPHPGNLFIVGKRKLAFIDLGMIGSFSKEVKRNMFLYYYNMVINEYENAVKYLMALCTKGPKTNEDGFRRELSEKINFWSSSGYKDYSLGHLILESMNIGAKYQMYFHGDLVLMSKALITIESVGNMFEPEMDINAVSEPFMQKLFLEQFSPLTIGKQFLNSIPDYMRFLENLPSSGLDIFQSLQKGFVQVKIDDDSYLKERRFLSPNTNKAFKGRNYSILTAACLLAGSVVVIGDTTPGGYIYFIRGLEDFPVLAGALFVISVFFGVLTVLAGRKLDKR
jgi:ubiquinone biosynthesis protein